MSLQWSPSAGQPAPSWWSSYRRTTQSSPWPSGYLMMHMCSAISDLSCYTAGQSHRLQNTGRESLTGATLLISHTALDSESAISPRNPVWPIYLMGGILLIDMWINLLLYFSSILGSDIVYWFIFFTLFVLWLYLFTQYSLKTCWLQMSTLGKWREKPRRQWPTSLPLSRFEFIIVCREN